MADIIRLLPDSVANQIAAGEVIQRPASVVKELMENALDAGATAITVEVVQAGKTLIRVTDDGCGMSETDARLAFERHATSKIRKADDLFAIRTMGFRGEALASIAAVAQVELKTKRREDELGTRILIAASRVESQEPVVCPDGSTFTVKNLFFNIPARRKFLKTNTTELKHIVTEFQRIVLTHPRITFRLKHNETEIYHLPAVANLRQRITAVFGKNINPHLIPIETDTSLVKIRGFIGKPEFARKTFGEQFFFTNGRFMKHSYFHKAVTEAYQNLLPPESVPSYFIYFDTDPERIDINIHPTKTEIKFEDERAVWQILHASVKEALGKYNIVPSLDFEGGQPIEIPVARPGMEVKPPEVRIDPDFNPFEQEERSRRREGVGGGAPVSRTVVPDNWERLYEGLRSSAKEVTETPEHGKVPAATGTAFLQFKQRYILFAVKSGLMIVDQRRAHVRILYEEYLRMLERGQHPAQQQLFPRRVELDAADRLVLEEIAGELQQLGVTLKMEGDRSVEVVGLPAGIGQDDPEELLRSFIDQYKISENDPSAPARERLARALAAAAAIPYGRALGGEEMRDLTDRLFACREPAYTPTGKPVFSILPQTDIEKLFE